MQLHLKSKQVAWCGVIMAIAVILQICAGVIETSSFFLLALASFLAGCVERKFDIKTAAVFCSGAVVLGVILAPQKLYCFTYAGFCVYVLAAEYFRGKNGSIKNSDKAEKIMNNIKIQYIIKGIIHHVLLIAAVFVSVKISGLEIIFSADFIEKIKHMPVFAVVFAAVIAAELLWFIFDRAYIFFQERYGIIVCGRE